uniref:Uncharacterized protein n=1 Tax=Anguilla anguilla TaxID=7936 RepID=A0A0E9ULC4_ANGAN
MPNRIHKPIVVSLQDLPSARNGIVTALKVSVAAGPGIH